jgi:hypothetical protein
LELTDFVCTITKKSSTGWSCTTDFWEKEREDVVMPDEVKVVKEVKPAEVAKEKEKKEKKVKEPKPVVVVDVKCSKAAVQIVTAKVDPRTGTRFSPGSARQLALEIVLKGATERKNAKEIKAILAGTSEKAGAKFNLDPSYFNYVISMHPGMFEVKSDGSMRVVNPPKPDLAAAAKMEADIKARKEKATVEREARKKAAEAKKAEKKEKKEEKASDKPVEKKEKKEEKQPEKK